MKIAIIGAGNIGSLLGALLTGAGQDVTLVELRKMSSPPSEQAASRLTCRTA